MKKRLTLEEHQVAGKELKEVGQKLRKVTTEIFRSYPKQSKVVNRAHAVISALDKLLCQLDDEVFEENPSLSLQVLGHIYMGEGDLQ